MKGSKGNLVLTGWYYPEYLAAAAAAYGGHYKGNAEVLGVSKSDLAAMLDVVAGKYQNVDILGVGLTENLDHLAKVLKELAVKGVRTRWFSRNAIPSEFHEILQREGAAFSEVHVKDRENLLDVVADCLDGVDGNARTRLCPLVDVGVHEPREYADLGKLSLPEIWAGLFLAAGFAHRDHRDEQACGEVVKALWEGVSVQPVLPPRFNQLMEDYRTEACNELIGRSKSLVALRARLALAARYEGANVLILGETGSGKQVVAEYIHSHSNRRNGPFVHYNCAYCGNADMLMDRLFGHVKGAFTGAVDEQKGLFDAANGGTLFLDEIGEANEMVQSMLLTVIETKKFTRVGGTKDIQVDVRLVCATNRDLQQMVLNFGDEERPQEGVAKGRRFRLDLYERLCDFPVRLDPLRDHLEDVRPLARYYWYQMTGGVQPTPRQIKDLMEFDYPGNVRELRSILKLGMTLYGDDPRKADFKAILADYRAFNDKLLTGLRARHAAEKGIRAQSEEWPENRDELLTRHAAKVFLKYGRKLSSAAKAADVSENTFRKFLAKAQREGLV